MIETVWNTFGTISYFIEGYFFYRVIGGFLEQRENRILRLSAYIFGSMVCTIVIFPQDPVNITLNLPLFFLMLVLGFREKMLVRISIILMFFPIIIAVNFLVVDMVGSMVIAPVTAGNETLNIILSNLMNLLPLGFWYGFQKILKNRAEGIVRTLYNKAWYLLDMVCLASLCAVISFVYYTPAQTYKVWIGMAACILTNIGSIWLVFYMAKSIRADMEGKNLKLQRDYYGQLEENQLKLRKFKHDMNNHSLVVSGLLEEGKTEEAKEYFAKLSRQFETKGRNFCKDSVVNAVLNTKYEEAARLDIDCQYQVDIDSLLFVDSLDICTILANTLDNAVEACQKIENKEKRKISVKARCTENGYFSYEITNTKIGETKERKGKFLTTKEQKESHGYGLENVRAAVERYKGTMSIQYNEESFCVTIFIAASGKWSP